jgi:hypothetical protein
MSRPQAGENRRPQRKAPVAVGGSHRGKEGFMIAHHMPSARLNTEREPKSQHLRAVPRRLKA